MFFYIVLSFLLFLCLFYHNKTLRLYNFKIDLVCIGFLLISIISLLRFDVGWDYVNYYKAVSDNYVGLIERFEPLSQVFFDISVYFPSPPLVFWLFGVPTYFFVYKTIVKYSISPRFSVLLYFCFFYLESLGFIRQALAVSISFWAIRFVFEKKFWRFLICIIVATLFHFSAILILFAYPIYRRRIKLWHLFWIIPLLFFVKKIVLSLLFSIEIYASYLEKLDTMEGGSLIRLFYIMLISAVLLLKNKNLSDKEHFFVFTIILASTFPFLLGSHLGVRLSSYFFIYFIILIPNVITQVKKRTFFAMVAFLFFLLTLFLTTRDPIKSQYVPYQFIFEVSDKPVFREAK